MREIEGEYPLLDLVEYIQNKGEDPTLNLRSKNIIFLSTGSSTVTSIASASEKTQIRSSSQTKSSPVEIIRRSSTYLFTL